jgi:hypothetical protein
MPFFGSCYGVLVAHQLSIDAIAQTVKGQLLNLANARRSVVRNAHMHICFAQRFGDRASALARQGNDGHVTFVRSMQSTHQTLFFACGSEQQQHIAGMA